MEAGEAPAAATAPAPPATGASTAPRRKILVRRSKKDRDTMRQTAEAESVRSMAPSTARGDGLDTEEMMKTNTLKSELGTASARGSTPASSTARGPTLKPAKRIDFDALRGGRETSAGDRTRFLAAASTASATSTGGIIGGHSTEAPVKESYSCSKAQKTRDIQNRDQKKNSKCDLNE